MDKKKVGERLKQLRIESYETQTELAKALGISLSSVAMYETGKRRPSDVVKKKYCDHFKRDIESLFFCD